METGKIYKSQTTFTVDKAAELPYGEFKAIISTEALDRHNEHVSIKGMKIPRKNYKIYWNHLTDGMNLPIGKWLKVWKKDGVIYGHGKLAVDKYDFAKTVYDLMTADEGYIDSTSVSFMPEELDTDTMTWTKSEFVEASLVGEPANTEALVFAKKLGVDMQEQEKEFREQVEKEEEAEAIEVALKAIPELSEESEIKAIADALKAQAVAVGIAIDELTQNPDKAKSVLYKIRLHSRSVKRSAEQVDHLAKTKYKVTFKGDK